MFLPGHNCFFIFQMVKMFWWLSSFCHQSLKKGNFIFRVMIYRVIQNGRKKFLEGMVMYLDHSESDSNAGSEIKS